MKYIDNINNNNSVDVNGQPKRKSNFFRNFWITFLTIAACVGVGVSAYFIYQSFKPTHVVHDTTSQKNFIRERTMSMRFETYPHAGLISQTFGTTWIIGQDSVNKEKFYMATNIHVIASSVISTNSDLTLPTNSSSKYTLNKKYINNVFLSFPDPKNPHDVKQPDLDLIEEQFTSTNLPTVEYVATSYDTYTYNNTASGEIVVPYSMSDLAILGFDTSKSTQNFKDYLSFNYLKNPTKFSLNPDGPSPISDYFIGGYPINNATSKKVSWNFDDSYNDAKRKENAILITAPKFSTGNSTIDTVVKYPAGTKVHGSNKGIIFPEYIGYAPTQTPAEKYENYAFQNISDEIIISNLDLGGGSSGSMAINKDNEVVGIYWGAYVNVYNNGKKDVNGSFDCFIANGNGYSYNLLKDIKKTIKTISNGNWADV